MWRDFLLLSIIHGVLASNIQNDLTLEYECETNSNCSNILINSICRNRRCVLERNEFRYRRQINYGTKMLGEECAWNNQCRQTPVDGTRVCLEHKCQCSRGYAPIDAYRCIRDFEMMVPTTQVTKAYDNEPPGYGSACSINTDCQHTAAYLECIRGTCVCLDGYVPLGKYLCYNIRGQGTSSVESSTIISTLSSLASIKHPDDNNNNEVMKSLGKIGNTCTNDYFCRRTVSQSHCYNGRCACVDGYISTDQYTCAPNLDEDTTTVSTPMPADYKSLLGGNCLTKRNCHTFNAICSNSICSCPKRYFPVDDWTCLPEPESSDEDLLETTSILPTITTTTVIIPALLTTTIFRWWPWSPIPTTPRPTTYDSKNTFRVRCLLNRQCASMDRNSHCTLFGRCICNRDYQLETTQNGQRCILRVINEDDCD